MGNRGISAGWAGFLVVATTAAVADDYPWPRQRSARAGAESSLEDRIAPPPGFTRVETTPGSYAAWLRGLPLLPKGAPVRSYAGAVLNEEPLAVIDLDVGDRDLQQCADSIIRLRAEYLRSRGRDDDIAFHFTSGDLARWKTYAEGRRPDLKGRRPLRWVKRAKPDDGQAAWSGYLRLVFGYAGTLSLAAYTPKVPVAQVAPGDFFVVGGSPGHAVVVLDVAVGPGGQRRLLLGQGFMPAQSFHVIGTPAGEMWHALDEEQGIRVPSWPAPFGPESLRRFP